MSSKIHLDISSLVKATRSLKEAIEALQQTPENNFIRDAIIQRFEYTYELSTKTLKRYLEMTDPNPASIDEKSFQDLIRLGAERGLLNHSWDIWKEYRMARNITSHTYDENKAKMICELAEQFLIEVELFVKNLSPRLASSHEK